MTAKKIRVAPAVMIDGEPVDPQRVAARRIERRLDAAAARDGQRARERARTPRPGAQPPSRAMPGRLELHPPYIGLACIERISLAVRVGSLEKFYPGPPRSGSRPRIRPGLPDEPPCPRPRNRASRAGRPLAFLAGRSAGHDPPPRLEPALRPRHMAAEVGPRAVPARLSACRRSSASARGSCC